MSSWLYSDGIRDLADNNILPGFADQISETNVLMKLLMNDGSTKPIKGNSASTKAGFLVGGDKIERTIDIAALTAKGWYRGYSPLKSTQNRTTNSVVQNFTGAYATVMISFDEEDKARGSQARINLVKYKIGKAYQAVKGLIGPALYYYDGQLTGDNIFGPNGLGQLLGTQVSNVAYGGVDRSWMGINSSDAGHEYWDANFIDESSAEADLLDPSSSDHIFQILSRLEMACRHNGKRLTHILTTPTLWLAYEEALRQKQVINSAKEADLGFQMLYFRGIPVIAEEDDSIPDHMVYGLNLSDVEGDGPGIKVYGREGRFFKMEPWRRVEGQAAYVADLFVSFAIWCDNPRYQGAAGLVGYN
jgi:hypothetical protein